MVAGDFSFFNHLHHVYLGDNCIQSFHFGSNDICSEIEFYDEA